MSSVIVAQNWIFGPLYGGIRGNICALCKFSNTSKPCSRVSSRECQLYSYDSELAFLSHHFLRGLRGNVCDSSLARCKADSRLSIGNNWTFFSLALITEAIIRRNPPLLKGWVTLELNISLKGYVYHQHLYTVGSVTTLPLQVFTQRNFVPDFIWMNLNFIHKKRQIRFEPPFVKLGVTYALHL